MSSLDRALKIVPKWVQRHCVVPDGDRMGAPFRLGAEQARFMLNHYLVRGDAVFDADAERPIRAAAFVYRRSQLVRSQKWGKSPLVSAFVCVEGVGPVLFAGWAGVGDVYDCAAHGCSCGWVYEYAEGEPMGRPWSTPLIQITATSEDQTDNTYDVLRPMIEQGPLSELIPKTGEEFIRLPGSGRIDVVTSKGTSRLGQRVTFVVQDETGLWIASNGGHNLAKKQRQGLAGMSGRAIETTNAWDPSQDSVAQRTFESNAKDINKDFRQPPADLKFDVKEQRRQIFAFNYAGAPWVDIDSIEGQAFEMLEKDPTDAERFFGNRIVAGLGHWMDMPQWEDRAAESPVTVKPRTKVCLGFDGSDNDDHTGIRLETLDFYQFTPTYGDGRKTLWNPVEWGGRIPRAEVRAAIDHIAADFEIVRAYCDPHMWETEIDEWAGRYGERVFIQWPTYTVPRMWAALDRFKTDVSEGKLSHDNDPAVAVHMRNAVVRPRAVDPLTGRRQYILGKPHESSAQKIDYVMSSVLAHEAVGDAIAGGALEEEPDEYIYY